MRVWSWFVSGVSGGGSSHKDEPGILIVVECEIVGVSTL